MAPAQLQFDETTTDAGPALPPMPADLDAPRTKLVYLGLHAAGEATVDELHDHLDEPRLSLYPVLSDLRERGLVVADGEQYRLTT